MHCKHDMKGLNIAIIMHEIYDHADNEERK